MTTTSRTARAAAAVAVATLTLTATGIAGAQQSAEVNTEVGEGSRQLTVTDLAGQSLTELGLRPGVAAPFAVRVTDTDLAPSSFQVDGVLNDLYLETGEGAYNFNATIPSSDVTLGYAATPIDAVGALLDLDPDYLVDSAVGAIDCADITASLGLTVLQVVTDPVCSLVSGLLGGTGVVIDQVPLDGIPIEDIDLTGLAASALPVALSAADLDSGVFTNPDCANGIATDNGACATAGATAQTMLQGRPLTGALTGTLDAALGDAIDGAPSASTVTAIIQSLQNGATSAVQQLGNRLASYDAADQITLVEDLFTIVDAASDATDLLGVTGVWTSFPTLTVDPTTTTQGTYAGTMTVTLIEP